MTTDKNHQVSNKDIVNAFYQEMSNIADACVGCGKCYEVCPITEDAGLNERDSKVITANVKNILKDGEIDDDAKHWAQACVLSGNCISACEYGVNPRLMLTMARMATKEKTMPPRDRLKNGIDSYNEMATGVRFLSNVQLDELELGKLGQRIKTANTKNTSAPDYLFHTSCNVLKTPHIALLCLDIMDKLSVSYEVKGGPESCCGILHYRAGDIKTSSRISTNTIDQFSKVGTQKVLSWCPTCQVQFTEVALPSYQAATKTQPFKMMPFILFLEEQLTKLKPLLKFEVRKKIALHLHPGVEGLPEAAKTVLRAVKGVEIVDLQLRELGLMSNSLSSLPELRKDLHRKELEAAEKAGVDALVAVYHADHRELCAHESVWSFEVINILEIIGEAMGIQRFDQYKSLKLMEDLNLIIKDLEDKLGSESELLVGARPLLEKFLLNDQPLPVNRWLS